ncbi:hypothetical protein C1645_821932 [Glomus cerebriforme]|uniref:Uncharacterized protein n=1 Tax=Glomus cerebriforme TaxID=658196 RepID=A0A397T120_9GLOM|nr:hypothetical protein C1645_821932 [Glomus cerebriforme]
MVKSYNCLRLDNKYIFQVNVYQNENDKDNKKFFKVSGDKKYPFDSVKVRQVMKLISYEGKFKDSETLELWKVNDNKDVFNSVSTGYGIKQLGGVPMKYQQIPGGSGIGKSRVGMESQHLISYAEESVLINISPSRIDLVKASLNDSCYIFIDFNDGCKYFQKLDKMHSSVRIGARIAVASGIAGKILEDLPEESFNLYRLNDVMQEILYHHFKTTHRSLEAVIIHIDEYQMYIDDVQRDKKISREDARRFFKDMLHEICCFMSNQNMNKSEHEFFIIPICTGTSAIDLHFLHNVSLICLKPLSYSSALKMFFDKYDPDNKKTEICNFISKQEHFHIALFDTGFVPKFLDDFLSPKFITLKTDWENNLHHRMTAESVKVDSNNPDHWKSIKDIRTIISFGLTRQIVERDFLLPSNTSIGDIERDGLIFLAIPENYPNIDKFIIIIPFMLLKILNQMLLPHPFFPDELLLISTIDRPWQWQDFECLHGYYQKALIEALINIKKARIQYLKEINDSDGLIIEEQKNWCLSDIFRGAKGNANLLKCQVKLHQLDIFTEKNKLLVETMDIAEFKRSVLCKDEITHSLEMAIFHCADEYANIDHHLVLESTSNGKPLAIFIQDKYSDLNMNNSTISGPDLKRWVESSEMPQLLLIDDECIAEYLSPTFAHRVSVITRQL